MLCVVKVIEASLYSRLWVIEMEERSFQVPDTVKSKAYDDAAHPFMGWLGKTGGAFGHALYAVIGLPVEKWAQRKEEQMKKLSEQMEARILSIPEDRRVEPSFGTVQSIFDGLDSCLDEEILQAGFVNLLESAMDSRTASGLLKCHANTLKQLCPDEARVLQVLHVKRNQPFIDVRSHDKGGKGWMVELRYVTDIDDWTKCEAPDNIPSYLVHLETLGLLRIDEMNYVANDEVYNALEKRVSGLKKGIEDSGKRFEIGKGVVYITPLGEDFAKSCGLQKFNHAAP